MSDTTGIDPALLERARARFAEHFGDLHEAVVGPPGDLHGLVVEKDLQAQPWRLAECAAQVTAVGDSARFQIDLENLPSSRRVQTVDYGGVRNRIPAIDDPATGDMDCLAGT